MKMLFTAKETRKLTTALNLIKSAVEQTPFIPKGLVPNVSVDSRFTINDDGSSSFEIHEKSFGTFLESGSEAFVAAGTIVKDAVSGLTQLVKNLDRDMCEASVSIANRGEAFNRKPESPFPSGLAADQKEFLRQAFQGHSFDPFDHYEHEEAELDQMLRGMSVQCVPSDSKLVPYSIRLKMAARLVKEGIVKFYKATREFDVKVEDLRALLNTM